jgi:hypothetical protein
VAFTWEALKVVKMVKLGDKSVCLWHAFNTLAGGDTRVVNKSKLKVRNLEIIT